MKTNHAFLTIALVVAMPLAAERAPRVALVIGNGSYAPQSDPLALEKNIPAAERDAEAVHFELEELGFHVIRTRNASKTDLGNAIADFRTALGTAGAEGVVYYSGHGATFRDHNYIIPIGVDTSTAQAFVETAVPMSEIYSALIGANVRIGVVLFDACRTSAFHNEEVKAGLREPVGNEVSSRLVTGFADQPGKAVAAAIDGEHSAYALGILEHIGTAGQTLEEFFIEVGNTVDHTAQRPYQTSAQRAQFYFRDPVYLEVWGDEADDDLIVAAGLDTYIRSVDGPSKRLRLRPGKNVVTVFVVNHGTKTGGQLLPEGWHYTVRMSIANGPSGPRFSASEPEQPVPRSRWKRTFVAVRTVITVDRRSVAFEDDPEDAVWTDGFSAFAFPGDELYATAKWGLLLQGIPVYDAETEETKRNPAVLRTDFIRAHDDAARARNRLGVDHKSHSDVRNLLEETPDAQIDEAVRRVRAEVPMNMIAEHLKATCSGERRNFCQALRSNEQWLVLRALYADYQQTSFDARHLLGILSNRELRDLYDGVIGAEN